MLEAIDCPRATRRCTRISFISYAFTENQNMHANLTRILLLQDQPQLIDPKAMLHGTP